MHFPFVRTGQPDHFTYSLEFLPKKIICTILRVINFQDFAAPSLKNDTFIHDWLV